MKKLLPLLFVLPLFAYDNAWYWEPYRLGTYWDCCFHGSFGVEGIYWKPCVEPFTYGTIGPETNQQTLDLSSKYRWGFRLFAAITDSCQRYFVDIDWIYYNNSTSVKVSDKPELTILSQSQLPGITAASIRAQQKLRYNRVSLKAGKNFCHCFFAYMGGGWREIRMRRLSSTTGETPPQTLLKTEFSGGAIEGGVGARVDIGCGVGASMRIGALALIGNREYSEAVVNFQEVPLRLRSPSHTICTTGVEVRAGIHFTKNCQGLKLRAEVGYELDTFFNVLLINKPTLDNKNRFGINAGFGGPFISLSAGF